MRPETPGVEIVRMREDNAHLYNSIPSRFEIRATLRLSLRDGAFSYGTEELKPPYKVKTYTDDALDTKVRHAVYFAMEDGTCVGQVYIREFWNGMACVEDIRVAEGLRGKGVGRRLMDAAVGWAAEQGFRIVCLETQDNNADACRFYAAYGFRLQGVDMAAYDNYPPLKGETALHWYLPMDV